MCCLEYYCIRVLCIWIPINPKVIWAYFFPHSKKLKLTSHFMTQRVLLSARERRCCLSFFGWRKLGPCFEWWIDVFYILVSTRHTQPNLVLVNSRTARCWCRDGVLWMKQRKWKFFYVNSNFVTVFLSFSFLENISTENIL